MDDQARPPTVVLPLRPTEQYFIARMLMVRERLTPGQWASFERAAEAICDGLLERLPVEHPGSAAWDNRRRPGRAAPPAPGGRPRPPIERRRWPRGGQT